VFERIAGTLAKHPAHIALAAFTLGLLVPGHPRAAALGAALTAAVLAAICGRTLLALLAALALVGGTLLGGARLRAIDATRLGGMVGSQVSARGYVARRERTVRGETRVRIRLTAIGLVGRRPEDVDEQVQLRVPPAVHLGRPAIGGELWAEGRLTELPVVPNADFDYAGYLRRAGVHALLRASSARATGRRRGGPAGAVDTIRRRAELGVGAGLPPGLAALARGMVLGEDEQIDARTSQDFKRSGLAHLLAVSGQNITLLALLAFPAFGLIGLRRRTRLLGVLALIAVYVPLTGAGASIVRAGVMGAAGVTAALSGRPASRWYAVLAAAAVTLAIDPRAWQDVGWQLSFAAVIGIFALMPGLTRALGRLPDALRSGLAMTLAATLATAPLMAFHFGRLSIVSLLANLVALPAVAPIMWIGMIDALLAQLSLLPAELINALGAYPLAYVAGVARWTAGLPLAVASVTIGSPAGLALAYGAIGLCALVALRRPDLIAGRRRRVGLAIAVTAIAVVLTVVVLGGRQGAAGTPPGFEVTFLDVGQGDATLLRTPAGASVLVDCGPPEADLAGKLARWQIDALDLVVATHPQRDHEGGCADVLKRLKVAALLDGGSGTPTAEHRGLAAAAHARHTRVLTAQAGQRFQLGALGLRVVNPAHPYEPDGEDPNNQAIVIVASYGSLDLLLTADAESDVTGGLTLPRVELLKVAHHGSADPGLAAQLELLRPQLAAIEVGAQNRYGHPTAATLAVLKAVPRVYRTDRDGDVRVLATPQGLEVSPSR
jgi:competence protein ComEC